MWVFTKVGFFSAVEGDLEEGQTEPRLMVRARVKGDLEALRSQYAPELGPTLEWPGRDYPYRAFISKQHFAEAMVRAVLDLDYGNFKSKVAEVQGYDRAHLYGGVWSVMNDADRKLAPKPTTELGKALEKGLGPPRAKKAALKGGS